MTRLLVPRRTRRSSFTNLPPGVVAKADAQRVRILRALAASGGPLALHGHWHRHVRGVMTVEAPNGSKREVVVIGLDMDGTNGNAGVLTQEGWAGLLHRWCRRTVS